MPQETPERLQKPPKTLPNPPKINSKTQAEKSRVFGSVCLMIFFDFDLENHGFLNDLLWRSGLQILIKIHLFFNVLSASFFIECQKCDFVKTVVLPWEN